MVPIAIGAVILAVIIGGAAAVAAVVPIFSVTAEKSLQQLLPATTVGYVSVDLNPAASTRADLNRITSAFTKQPGWTASPIAKSFAAEQRRSQSAACDSKVEKEASSLLGDLGHDTAVAVTSIKGAASAAGPSTALKNDVVALAPLHTQRTLFQAMTDSGLSLATPTTAQTYDGTTIDKETVHGCGPAAAQKVSFFAADYKNWVLLGATASAIHPIIDTGDGRSASLNTVTSYRTLTAALPSGALATSYINGAALKGLNLNGLTPNRFSLASSVLTNSSPDFLASRLVSSFVAGANAFGAIEKPSAAAFSVDGHGFAVTSLSLGSSSNLLKPAGSAAYFLPNSTEALISIADLPSRIRTALKALGPYAHSSSRYQGLAAPIFRDMTGETDVVVLKPAERVSLRSAAGLPLALMWKVNSGHRAISDLQRILSKLRLGPSFPLRAADGTRFFQVGSFGYGVRNGWMIISPGMNAVIRQLSANGQSLFASPRFQSAVPPSGVANSIWFLNLRQIRSTVEKLVLPNLPPSDRHAYSSSGFKLMLAPLLDISGSSGRQGNMTYSAMRVDIGS